MHCQVVYVSFLTSSGITTTKFVGYNKQRTYEGEHKGDGQAVKKRVNFGGRCMWMDDAYDKGEREGKKERRKRQKKP